MNADEFRKAAHAAVDDLADYIENLSQRPVSAAIEPGGVSTVLPAEPPQDGEAWSEIRKDIEGKIMPGITHWQSPNFMGFFPTAFSYPAVLGDLYSAALSSPAFTWYSSPAVTELEIVTLDWLRQTLHLPGCFSSHTAGGGVIQGSASEATLTTMVAARQRALRRACEGLVGLPKEEKATALRSRLVALGSDQAHSGVEKAALIVGVQYRSIATSVDNNFAVTGDAYQATIEQCRAEGLHPFHVTATLGTTGTCAIDDVAAICEANRDSSPSEAVWVHVDAAWAGATLILDDHAHIAASCEQVDSFDMNMHKWLLVNFDCSCLFVRNKQDLTDALSNMPAYMRNKFTDSGAVTDYRDWQIPFGRRFRSLKLWFVMRSYGVRGMQAYIKRHLDLGDEFAGWIRQRSDLFQIITPPAFALIVFAVRPRESHSQRAEQNTVTDKLREQNALTIAVYDMIIASGRLFVTKTVVAGIEVIRVVSGNYHTSEKALSDAFELIVTITEKCRSGP